MRFQIVLNGSQMTQPYRIITYKLLISDIVEPKFRVNPSQRTITFQESIGKP